MPVKRRRGRQSHEPSDKARADVQALAGFGVREDEIAMYIGIDPKTLRKHYRAELDTGHIKANAAVARSLYKQATEGNTAAAIFWMKARAGWRERIAITGESGGPIETVNRPSEMTDAELNDRLQELLRKTGAI